MDRCFALLGKNIIDFTFRYTKMMDVVKKKHTSEFILSLLLFYMKLIFVTIFYLKTVLFTINVSPFFSSPHPALHEALNAEGELSFIPSWR